MKKIWYIAVLLLMFGLFGCGGEKASETESIGKEETKEQKPEETVPEETEEKTSFDIALITGGWSSILDGGRYQSTWKGLASYAETEGISHHYFGAETEDKEALSDQIERAVSFGAKQVLGVGASMQEAVMAVASQYPEVQFCVLDAVGREDTEANVTLLEFDKMEAGYVAGYAAAAEGLKSFGFFSYGEMLDDRYQYGFLQGLEAAGKHLTRQSSKVYSVSFGSAGTEETMQETLDEWMNEGVQLIFCCPTARTLCSERAVSKGVSVLTSGEEILLQELEAVSGVIVQDYEAAVKNYLFGMYPSGHHYLEMGDEMIRFLKKDGAFSSFNQELEEILTKNLEEKEDMLYRNTKVSTAALGLEYVEFAY